MFTLISFLCDLRITHWLPYLLLALPTLASMYGLPVSYVITTPDETRAFVVLFGDDLDEVTLPDGRTGKPSSFFEESGVYDLTTMTLLWKNPEQQYASGVRRKSFPTDF